MYNFFIIEIHRIRHFFIGSDAFKRLDAIDAKKLFVGGSQFAIFIQFLAKNPLGILIAEKWSQGRIDEGAFRTDTASAMSGSFVAFYDFEIVVAAAEDIEILLILTE